MVSAPMLFDVFHERIMEAHWPVKPETLYNQWSKDSESTDWNEGGEHHGHPAPAFHIHEHLQDLFNLKMVNS